MAITIKEALDELEATDDIAIALREAGIDPMNDAGFLGPVCRRCPIAMYLQKKTGRGCWVSPWEARFDGSFDGTGTPLPKRIREYVSRVDDHRYAMAVESAESV